jgi:DNA-binding ferritin-like protein
MTDEIAERARKIGGTTLHSIGDIARHQRLKDSHEERVAPQKMLSELRDDNAQLTRFLRAAHEICERYHDVATTSLIEVWIDQTEQRSASFSSYLPKSPIAPFRKLPKRSVAWITTSNASPSLIAASLALRS